MVREGSEDRAKGAERVGEYCGGD